MKLRRKIDGKETHTCYVGVKFNQPGGEHVVRSARTPTSEAYTHLGKSDAFRFCNLCGPNRFSRFNGYFLRVGNENKDPRWSV
jgi:hypothetical protein